MFIRSLAHDSSLCSIVRSIWYNCETGLEEKWPSSSPTPFPAATILFDSPVVEALSSSKYLQAIELCYYGHEKQEDNFFGSTSSFFSVLQGWSAIERVVIDYHTIATEKKTHGWSEYDEANMHRHADGTPRATCPSLRYFNFSSQPLFDAHLSLLLHIAPSIFHLFLDTTNISDRAVAPALERWSHSLESLDLGDPGDEVKGRNPQADVNGIIASLPHPYCSPSKSRPHMSPRRVWLAVNDLIQ
ncbi:hypothetical protein BV25DRAFT_1917639 [Artomyces pyxidatus]|uniref:Uncharacterized protein n=1 Tax=Artomyces pyxidatus TaxID=48021 RepID=A0ACB8SWH3_9AGAM|nr:hypothetical protein BV25DRAFT_1917639 [Artomyces pyxidatus]